VWITTPDGTRILEQPNQLAFLGVNVKNGPSTLQKGLFLALQILKLLVSVRAGDSQCFAIDLSRIIPFGEESANRGRARGMLLA
jgi:hypothetical protein